MNLWNGDLARNTLQYGGPFGETRNVKVPLPGCKIGERKYDIHQMVLEKLGT